MGAYRGTYSEGFAPRDFAPRYPQLWNGCIKAYAPTLGPSGVTLRDWSGFQQHGTLTSLTLANAWVAQTGTYSVATDGTGYVDDTAFLQNPQGNVPFSQFAWVTYTNSATAIEIASFFGKDGSNQAGFLYRNATGKAVGEFGSGTGAATGTTTLSAGIAYALCHTYDGANSRIWVNGINEGTTAYSAANLANTRHIVGAYFTTGAVFSLFANAKFKDVRIYNRVLTANEIIMLSQRPGIAYEYDRRVKAKAAAAAATRQQTLTLLGCGA